MNETQIITTKISRIIIGDKRKDGTLLIDDRGNKYKKIIIKTPDTGDKWVSAFIRSEKDERLNWKIGDTITIKVEPSGDFLNFTMPTPAEMLEPRVKALEDWKKSIEGEKIGAVSTVEEDPFDGISPDDLNF